MERKKIISLFIYFYISLFLITLGWIFSDYFDFVTYISLIFIIGSIIIVHKFNNNQLSLGMIFFSFLYIFHFGQSIIISFWDNDLYVKKNIVSLSSTQEVINAELFSMLCILFMILGYCFIISKNKMPHKKFLSESYSTEIIRLRKISILLVSITIIPMIIVDIQKIIALSLLDYEATYVVYQTGIGKWLNLIGQFCRPMIGVLIFSFKDNKKVANYILGISTLYLLIMMISGDRGTNMIYLVSIYLIYFIFIKKVRKRTIIMGAILGYLLLTLISSISIFRYTDFSIKALIEAIQRRSSDGIIYSTLREFGGTMISLIYAMRYIPAYSNFNYGKTILSTVFSIFPILPDFIVDFFDTSFTFTKAFPIEVQYSLGGSLLGELYFNFGWLSIFFSIFIGIFIGKLDRKFKVSVNIRDIAIAIIMIPSVILWVRDFSATLFLKVFWLGIIIKYMKVRKCEKIGEMIKK